jgi:hypothetical protein
MVPSGLVHGKYPPPKEEEEKEVIRRAGDDDTEADALDVVDIAVQG